MNEPIVLSLAVFALAIVISMLVAVVIKGIVASISWMQKSSADSPKDAVASTPQEVESDQSDIAAITAAIYAVMGAHRIVHIERADRGHTWTGEGRVAHHTSHAIPRQPSRHSR